MISYEEIRLRLEELLFVRCTLSDPTEMLQSVNPEELRYKEIWQSDVRQCAFYMVACPTLICFLMVN